MANLYLTEQGAVLRKSGDRLIVEKDGRTLLVVPCNKIESVLIFGNVQFTTQALCELFEHEIEMALLTEDGYLRGQLTPIKNKNILLRQAQFRLSEDEAFARRSAAAILRAKLLNSAAVLRRFAHNHPDERVSVAAAEIGDLSEGISDQTPISSLLGVEGTAAKLYYSAMRHMMLAEFAFPGRVRRPPTDPVNALLSFGYVLLANELQSLLDAIGLDPYLGFLHQVEYGRPSLALDVLEEFRAPVIDRFTLYMINKRMLTPQQFQDLGEKGVRLTREGMKTFFAHYERWMNEPQAGITHEAGNSFRKALRAQAEAMAKAIREGSQYAPFRFT
jgi:CRISPR-associated protein Cas1